MSDAFRHHEFLLWNPFFSDSYPMHCDMQAPVWNPIVILFSWLFRYNATLLSVELLLYYVTGAIGCFYFARHFSRDLRTCLVIAVVYGCGGIATSILEFMSWVGSFAFLPWAAYFFYLLIRKQTIGSVFGLSVAVWLMLVTGYPSFLIYLGYCMVVMTVLYCCRLFFQKRGREVFAILGAEGAALVLVVLLALPAIVSYHEYLSYYVRGTRTLDAHINSEFFALNYPMSLLFPVLGTLAWDNDIYIGLVPLLILFCGLGRKPVFRFRDWVLLGGCLFTAAFTLGRSAPVRMWSARHLPLMATFGFSHCMAIFIELAIVVWLAPRLDLFFSDSPVFRRKALRNAARMAMFILLVFLAIAYPRTSFRTDSVRLLYLLSAGGQLAMLGLLGFSDKILKSGGRWVIFVIADLVFCVWMVVPLTGLTLTSPAVYNASAAAFYRRAVPGFLLSPAAKMAAIRQHDPRREVNAMKMPGRPNFPSNTRSDTLFRYLGTDDNDRKMLSLPFVFSDNGVPLKVHAISLGYNFIDVDVHAGGDCRMVFQQTYYQRWKAVAPGRDPTAYQGIFLQTSLSTGENRVRLFYYKKDLFIEGCISALTLLGMCCFFACKTALKKRRSKFLNLTI